MVGACGTQQGGEKHVQTFSRKTWREDYLRDQSIDGKIII
jgi:hypothetical protein